MTSAMSRPAIVIFGAAVRPEGAPSRTLRVRVEAALALGARLESPLYLPTGGIGRFGDAEAAVMAGTGAMANAVAAAVGSRIRELPMTSPRVWRAANSR